MPLPYSHCSWRPFGEVHADSVSRCDGVLFYSVVMWHYVACEAVYVLPPLRCCVLPVLVPIALVPCLGALWLFGSYVFVCVFVIRVDLVSTRTL